MKLIVSGKTKEFTPDVQEKFSLKLAKLSKLIERRGERDGVAGLDTLRGASAEMGVRLIACEAGLRAEALDPSMLLANVEVAGIATFLSAVGTGQIITI